MQAKINTTFNNEYLIQLRDSVTGVIKQEVKTHNVVLKRMWSIGDLISSNWTGAFVGATGITVGSGTGTPSENDTSLFTEKWQMKSDKTVTYFDNYNGVEVKLVSTFPATASYVATITEVGIRNNQYSSSYNHDNGIITHALLKDAEGNPITVTKTDLDELIVTAIMRFTMEGDGFKLLPLNRSWLGRYFNGDARLLCNTWLSLQRSKKGYAGQYMGYCSGEHGTTENSVTDLTLVPRPSYSISTHIFTFKNSRIVATKGNTHYFNCLQFNNFGYWPLPNPDVFPFYQIEDMEIGVGDGTRVQFDNPLNYYVKDTEVITVNNVPLTRNVDYTIDYKNNKDMLVEISEGNFAYNHSDLDVENTSYYPFFQACDTTSWQNVDSGNRMGKNAPMFIEFDEPKTINTLRISGLYGNRQNGSSTTNYSVTNATFRLSYSEDGQTYTELLTTEAFNAYNGSTFKFNDTIAKYFKLEIIAEQYLSTNNYYYMDAAKIVYPTCNECFIGYTGDPYITFTNPPAEDAVILMSVQMDRPFKNSNFVIDVTGEIAIV